MIRNNLRIIFFILIVFTFVFNSYLVFAEAPLTLEESIDIALKNSIVLNIAKEGSKGAYRTKKGSHYRIFAKIQHFIQLHTIE